MQFVPFALTSELKSHCTDDLAGKKSFLLPPPRETKAHSCSLSLSPSGPSLASVQEDTSWRLGNSCHLWRDLNPVGSWAEPIVLEPGVCLPLDNVLIWRQDCFFFSAPFLPPSPLPSPHTPTPPQSIFPPWSTQPGTKQLLYKVW